MADQLKEKVAIRTESGPGKSGWQGNGLGMASTCGMANDCHCRSHCLPQKRCAVSFKEKMKFIVDSRVTCTIDEPPGWATSHQQWKLALFYPEDMFTTPGPFDGMLQQRPARS